MRICVGGDIAADACLCSTTSATNDVAEIGTTMPALRTAMAASPIVFIVIETIGPPPGLSLVRRRSCGKPRIKTRATQAEGACAGAAAFRGCRQMCRLTNPVKCRALDQKRT